MENPPVKYYRPLQHYPNYLGFKNGWHDYSFVHFVADPRHFGGREYARVDTQLRLVERPGLNSTGTPSILGWYNIHWYTIIDSNENVVQPSITWSHSDYIQVPSNLNESQLQEMVIPIIGEALISRVGLSDKLKKIILENAMNPTNELQQSAA